MKTENENLKDVPQKPPAEIAKADIPQHYELDGISFAEDSGVVVSSDAPKDTNIPQVAEDDSEAQDF